MPLFGRHAREFRRSFARKEWERTPEGIYFPRQRALLHGRVKVETNRGTKVVHNAILDSGLYPLFAAGGTSAAFDNRFIAPWGAGISVTPEWIAGMQAGQGLNDYTLYYTLNELGDAPDGYDETLRQSWVWAHVSGGLFDNSGSPAAFTMRSLSSITVYGFALMGTEYKQRARPKYADEGVDPAGILTTRIYIDGSNVPEIQTNASGYVPNGATDTGPGGAWSDGILTGAHAINLNPIYIDGAVGPRYGASYASILGGALGGGGLAAIDHWYDTTGNQYFDVGSGHWVDPDQCAVDGEPTAGDNILAIAGIPAESFADGDPMNVTWGIELT